MSMHDLKKEPPQPRTREELENARRQFILGQDEQKTSPETVSRKIYEWEAPYVRKDVKKLFSLRFSEPDMLKLKFIHEKTGKSMHQFCMDLILPQIEAEIKRLTEE